MSKSRVFFLLSLAFIGGVFSASFYHPNIIDTFYLLVLVLISIICIAIFYKKPASVAGFFILFFAFGIYLTERKLEMAKNFKEEKFSGEIVVTGEPIISGRQQKIIAKARALNARSSVGHSMPVNEENKFMITTGVFPEYHYGDVLNIDCKMELPKNFSERSASSGQSADSKFDYRMYLAKDGIFYVCNNPQIVNTGENDGNKFYAFLLNTKKNLNNNILQLMPSPQSGLLSGLLIGGSGLLSKDYQNYFSLTGTTHIVAVSGYNVTIIAEYLMMLGIFIGLWRRQAFWFATIGIILFVILTGMPSSAVRAGVMGILLIWAMKNGRLANSQNAILFAASVMLLNNPLLLRWDVGFQLSFLATLGIVYVYPIFNDFLIRRDALQCVSTIREILLLTLAAQVFVLPVIFINFGKLSLISPIANLLVLPIIPLTMLIGFLAIIFSFIVPPLGQFFAWLAFLPLKYETVVIKFLAGLKYSSIDIGQFPWWAIVLWYIILISVISYFKKRIIKKTVILNVGRETDVKDLKIACSFII